MKALTNNGIDESKIYIGSLVNWQGKTWGSIGDAVSYIERDADGTITRIAFSTWGEVFNNRMKLNVEPYEYRSSDDTGMFKDEIAAVGHWYKMMQVQGKITIIA